LKIEAWGGGLSFPGQNRQMLAERAAENAAQVEAAHGGKPVDEADTRGHDSEEEIIQEEYENEEQLATVTVVEDFDMDALIHAEPPSEHPDPGSSSNKGRAKRLEHRAEKAKSTTTDTSGTFKKKAPSAKKFKYETKAARLAEKKRQQGRKFEKAARAGGKQSRSRKRK
jgi:ribosomal RNA-processing protein 17